MMSCYTVSSWYHPATEKKCKIHSVKNDGKETEFFITGYNPLPVKKFVSTYHVLAKWLKKEGWEVKTSEPVFINIKER